MSPVATIPRSYSYFPAFAMPLPKRNSLAGLSPGQYVQSAGAAAMQAAVLAGPAAPFVVAAGALVSLAGSIMNAIGVGTGCGPTCIAASNFANQAEAKIQEVVRQYFALPKPRSQSNQLIAVYAFDTIWQSLQASCGNPQLSTAGTNCIADRQAGACKWRQTSDSWLLQYPGEPQPGACWNWFNGYRDIIANDPNVVPDSQAAGATGTGSNGGGITSIGGLDMQSVLLYGGIGLLAVGLLQGMN